MGKIFLVIIKRAPLLTEPQIKTLVDIGIGFGQLMLGSVVLPFLLPGFDETKTLMVPLGLATAIASWTASIILARKLHV